MERTYNLSTLSLGSFIVLCKWKHSPFPFSLFGGLRNSYLLLLSRPPFFQQCFPMGALALSFNSSSCAVSQAGREGMLYYGGVGQQQNERNVSL